MAFKSTLRDNSNYGIESMVYKVHAPKATYCVNAKRVFHFRSHRLSQRNMCPWRSTPHFAITQTMAYTESE